MILVSKEEYKHTIHAALEYINSNKTPAKPFTTPAEKKIGTRLSFVKMVNE